MTHVPPFTKLCPCFSPLTEVDLEDVGMFLIQLTNRDFLQSKPDNVDELDNCHDAIAFSLCNQIIAGMCICFESRKKTNVHNFDKISLGSLQKLIFRSLYHCRKITFMLQFFVIDSLFLNSYTIINHTLAISL